MRYKVLSDWDKAWSLRNLSRLKGPLRWPQPTVWQLPVVPDRGPAGCLSFDGSGKHVFRPLGRACRFLAGLRAPWVGPS